MNSERIPLFPLELVLFPGTQLPLHIFEPRYKEMVKLCLDQRCVFGVVLTRSGEIAETGCTAEITEVVRQYPDGRMDILTRGMRVFRIRRILGERAYSEGLVEYLEEATTSGLDKSPARLLEAFHRCHELIYHQRLDLNEVDCGAHLSYQLGTELPVPLDVKQDLLQMRSESDRRARLLAHLEEWAPQLERANRVRNKAASNGHSHD